MSLDSPASILFDSAGNPIEVITFGGKYYMGNSMLQNVTTSIVNTSIAPIASGASFTGGSESTFGVAGLQVCVNADQPIRVSVQQSNDGTNWDFKDEYDLPPSQGDGRTTQAVSEYFRVVVKNLGPATTTYFNLKSVLCPTVEAVPRSLTPRGRLSLSSQTTNWIPAPQNFLTFGMGRALMIDTARNLVTRSQCLTDEGTFRDDFVGNVTTALTGVCHFRLNEKHVSGVGTSFLSQIVKEQYLRLSTDGEDKVGIVSDVYSDTDLVLEDGYDGSTASGSGLVSNWKVASGAGGSISSAASILTIDAGTTGSSLTQVVRVGDYLPMTLTFYAAVSQRIVDQELVMGMMDDDPGLANKQVSVVFSGTDNTKCILRTSISNTDIEETTITLPYGATTDNYNEYRLEIVGVQVIFLINQVRAAVHRKHIPSSYDSIDLHLAATNTGVPASPTTLSVDVLRFYNFDQVEIALATQGVPLDVQERPATVATDSNVPGANVDTLLLAHNSMRLGATIYNDSSAILYVKLGLGASLTSFTVRMRPYAYYELPYGYTGQINGIWAASAGAARITELV